MSLWIKICANTSLADAQLAAEAGADAVGFVFAPSPRRVTVEQVAKIVPHLPAAIEKIGVFVDAVFEEIAAAVETAGLTGVQLHFGSAPGTSRSTAQRNSARRCGFWAWCILTRAAGEHAAVLARDANLDALLVDSRTAAAVGGTGQTYDWSLAAKTLFQSKEGRKPLVAAGGLNPGNVAKAIATLRPWAWTLPAALKPCRAAKMRPRYVCLLPRHASPEFDLRTQALAACFSPKRRNF